ncbi:restriction endonuclease subunit S [Plantactinospora sp. WMMB334]|uniref:restriction endonuclease subunit S n=1 Tax=Plantactinospora sp. WMMB334 TaxID=3404119 RepID=UPI003B954428
MTTVRLRHIAQINPPTPAFDHLSFDDELTFMPMESVWPGDRLDTTQRRTKSAVSTGYTRFQNGDVLVPKITPTFEASRSVLISGLHNAVGAGSTELHVVRPGRTIDPRFLLYLTHTHAFLRLGQAEMYGVAGQQRVPDQFLRDLRISLPPLSEQRRIASFLDTETTRLNRLIEYRLQQCTALEERWYAEVSETLIPGITRNSARMPPWPWLPPTQRDRPLVRLGYICRLQSGITIDGKREDDGTSVTRPYLRVANVQAGYIDLSSITEVTVPKSMAIRSTLRPGDVLMTEGGDLDKLGRGTVWDGQIRDCLHQNHVFALRPDPDRLDTHYLALMTQTLHGRSYFESTGSRTTNLASTSSSKILNFPIPLPPVAHQRKIVHNLQQRHSTITRTIGKLKRQLELLAERRHALITAAVTKQTDTSTAGQSDGIIG